jgi:hypothetical protein
MRDYAAYLKNAINFCVAEVCKMNIYGYFAMCICISECRSLKG